jgi:uncharacterized protein (DUF2147 family)
MTAKKREETMKYRTTLSIAAAILFSVAIPFTGLAQSAAPGPSPAGLWKTIDDETGKPKAIIRITESSGEFRARIEKLFEDPVAAGRSGKCDKCEDERKDQPIVGMTILTGMKKTEGRDYAGGQILDPANGKVYKAKMELEEDGKKLNVRGYIGVPMLGRTQVWLREQ